MAKWQTSPFGPPQSPGVYCVCLLNLLTKEKQTLYIGSSKNIRNRVMTTKHPYRQIYNEASSIDVAIYVKYKECSDYIAIEKRLIRRIKPMFNRQHTSEEYMSYKIKL